MPETRNARIASTMLGVEDHGILTCMLHLECGGVGQGFGGYTFDEYGENDKARHGVAFGMEFIRRVLKVVGVQKWEDLPGKYIRADADNSKVYRIGHITEDKWFDPQELAEEARNG